MNNSDLLGTQWKMAADLLRVGCVAPFVLESPEGQRFSFACLLPDFGAARGTLVLASFNRDAVEAAKARGYTCSSMGLEKRLPFDLESYKECLTDWGWTNENTTPPDWYPRNGV